MVPPPQWKLHHGISGCCDVYIWYSVEKQSRGISKIPETKENTTDRVKSKRWTFGRWRSGHCTPIEHAHWPLDPGSPARALCALPPGWKQAPAFSYQLDFEYGRSFTPSPHLDWWTHFWSQQPETECWRPEPRFRCTRRTCSIQTLESQSGRPEHQRLHNKHEQLFI